MRKLALTLLSSSAMLAGSLALAPAAQASSGDAFLCSLFPFAPQCWSDGGGGDDIDVERPHRRGKALRGTKCWKFKAAFGKPAFAELHFFNSRHGHSLVSGTVTRADGVNKKPDRVILLSGSATYNSFVGDNETEIKRYLLNLTYSLTKTGTNPANAFAEIGFHQRGHYNVRLNSETLDGVFAGNDFIFAWTPPLTGPTRTLRADQTVAGGRGVTANYMGGIECDSAAGRECGLILPLNNAGTWELIGRNKRQCDNARENFGPDFVQGQ